MQQDLFYSCDLDPDSKTVLNVYLYKNVQNTEEIRNKIVKGFWDCAVVKPSLILDPFQIAVAANRAVVSGKQNTLVTKTVFAEILYNLSLTKNITQSLSKFGIEKDENLLLCFIKTTEKDHSQEILSQIKGEQCPMSELSDFTNLKQIKTVYKLNNLKCDDDLLNVVVSRIVTKNFVSH